jgi:hypothetical protein
MLAFIQGPSGGAESVERPSRFVSETSMLPEAVIVFNAYDTIVNYIVKSTYLNDLIGNLSFGSALDVFFSRVNLLPEHILFLIKQGYYMGGYEQCSFEYRLNTPSMAVGSNTTGSQPNHNGGMLLVFSPIGSRPTTILKHQPTTTEALEVAVQGNLLQRQTNQLSQFVGANFVINNGQNDLHGHFLWFDKAKDITLIATGLCKGNPSTASQMAAHVMALLHLVVVEQGYAEGDEIMNRLSYYLYKFTRDKVQLAGPMLEISVVLINRKHRWVELTGSQVGCFYLQNGNITWLKGSRSVVGDPKILLSKQDYRSTRFRTDDLDAIYLYTTPLLDQPNDKSHKPMGRQRLANSIESVSAMPLADQATLMLDHINSWRGGQPIHEHHLLVGFRVD